MAIFAWIIGGVWYILGFYFLDAHSAVQETVQLLVFVNGSIFIVGGMILLMIKKESNSQKEQFFEILNKKNGLKGENENEFEINKNRLYSMVNDPEVKNHIEYIEKTKGIDAAKKRIEELLEIGHSEQEKKIVKQYNG